MVSRLDTGKSIRTVVAYNEKKVETSAGELLFASGFPMELDKLSFNNKVDFFNKFTRQHTRAKTNTMHITLNFSPKDSRLDTDKLIEIAKKYMSGIGYGGQPYLVYQHFDAAHPHLHVVTVNIANGGQRIATHNIGKTKAKVIREEIEETYGLIRAQDQKKAQDLQIGAIELKKIVYGKVETKRAISTIVSEVVGSYKYCSVTELNAVLNQFGVYADGGVPGSTMHNNGGLIYGILDQNNKKVGIPIKASSINSRPTLNNLKRLFTVNKLDRKPYGLRLKYLLDNAIESSGGLADMEDILRKQGIRVIFRKSVQSDNFAVTFIDNTTRVVLNGTELGKKYGAKTFSIALQQKAVSQTADRELFHAGASTDVTESAADEHKISTEKVPCMDLPVIETFVGALFYEEEEPSDFQPDKKKIKEMQLSH